MSGPFRCAVSSAERGEPLFGTASAVSRWLLVEQPGPWGPSSFPESRLAPETRESLHRQARALGARAMLIRRHGAGGEAADEPRSVFVVDSRPGAERTLHRTVRDEADLDPLVLDSGWRRVHGPLYLVCTHGRHDRCCALRGRPVAQELGRAEPERTWECTHIGGDRFAANVVVLPEGLYLGRLEVDEVVDVVRALEDGELPAGRVRGRSSLSLPAQAAQQFAREATGRWGVDDLAPVVQEPAGSDTWRIVLAGDAGPRVEVVVCYDRTGEGEPSTLTCGALEAKTAPLFRLVSLVDAAGEDDAR